MAKIMEDANKRGDGTSNKIPSDSSSNWATGVAGSAASADDSLSLPSSGDEKRVVVDGSGRSAHGRFCCGDDSMLLLRHDRDCEGANAWHEAISRVARTERDASDLMTI